MSATGLWVVEAKELLTRGTAEVWRRSDRLSCTPYPPVGMMGIEAPEGPADRRPGADDRAIAALILHLFSDWDWECGQSPELTSVASIALPMRGGITEKVHPR